MKKLLTWVLLTLFLTMISYLPPSPLTAKADTPSKGAYACVLSDAFFYAEADERKGLFLIPKTYYVKLVEYGSPYCKVEYMSDGNYTKRLVGYTKTECLTFVKYTPSRPYLTYIFDVNYRIEDADSTDGFLTGLTVTCAYYGDYKIGSETYCYVLRGDEFGYIPKPTSISYEDNTEYADYLASQKENEPPTDSSSTASPSKKGAATPIQIAILITLCLLVPVLAALILKPPRRPSYEKDE